MIGRMFSPLTRFILDRTMKEEYISNVELKRATILLIFNTLKNHATKTESEFIVGPMLGGI